jgi:flagellar basal body-associated protein FliL
MAAAAEDKKEESASSSAPASNGGGSKLVLIVAGVNVVLTLAMVAILFISFQKDKKGASVADISTKEASEHGEAKGGEGKEGEHGEGKEGEHGAASAKKKTGDFGKMVTLEQFTVNLSTPGSANPKFARINMSLEVPNEDTEPELTSKMPQVRNAIIDLVNSKRSSDLATAEGRDYLKEEIKNALNGFMVTGKVKGVFFTAFALTG